MPVSRTVSRYETLSSAAPVSSRVTVTLPPSGVNLNALLMRFKSTRFKRLVSHSTMGCSTPEASTV